MNAINQIFDFISKLFEWWFIVMPWEQAVFIRRGKHSKVLGKGIYFKVPLIDRVYIQPIRIRMVDLPVQTVSTPDNKTITIKALIGYSIKDIFKLYNSISHPDMTLAGMVMGNIAEYVKTTNSNELSPIILEGKLLDKLKENDYGIGDLSVKITSWADVRTFRLIQDSSFIYEQSKMGYIGERPN